MTAQTQNNLSTQPVILPEVQPVILHTDESVILPEKNKGGRPVKWTEEALCELGEELIQWLEASDDNIFFEEFLIKKGLYKDILNKYIDSYSSFFALIKRCTELQAVKLQKGGLSGKYRDAMSIFLLKAKHGLREKDDAVQGLQMPVVINLLPPGVSNITDYLPSGNITPQITPHEEIKPLPAPDESEDPVDPDNL